jgi:putative transposase
MRQRMYGFAVRKYRRRKKGAGRKRVLPGKPRLAHRVRQRIPYYLPVHVTWRIHHELPSLRTKQIVAVAARAFGAAQARFGMRVTHWVVEGNHIHLIVEGISTAAMKGLGVRLAKAINRRIGRTGRVIGDTYHAHALRTKSEVRHAVHYVLDNHQRHTGRWHTDPHYIAVDGCGSEYWPDSVVKPRSWLLNNAWTRPPRRRR